MPQVVPLSLTTLPEVQKFQIKFWHSTNSDWSFNMGVYEKFFFTILNDVEKSAILREKVLFLNFLYYYGDLNYEETFWNLLLEMYEYSVSKIE